MTTGEEIRQAIRHIISQYLVTTKLREPKMCTVKNVYATPNDAMVCDCEPNDKTAIIKNVRLIANYTNNKAGFVLAPKKNSVVEISFNADSDAFVSMVSEVDFIYLNGNDYGGLVQVQPLVDKLNNLENLVNDLKDKYNSHTHSGVTVGSGITGPIDMPEPTNLTNTQKADLENTTVLHGTGNLS
ncbi:MAG TPA: hypothetical protein VN698_12035 [Bacteroidia bacterium]|nr:hypothetical protein [Bacteroidia bacterium]